jgi:hypothetical protein
MVCRIVSKQLSEYIDEVLDAGAAVQVSQHLNICENCRKEYESLVFIQQKLKSLPKAKAPAYLRSLIQHQLSKEQESWRLQLRNFLERRWSIIRTTEGIWYMSKALGMIMTSICILLISSVITPYYDMNAANPTFLSPAYSQQVGMNVLIKLGLQSAPPYEKSSAAINNIYFANFGKSVSPSENDVNLSVVAEIDRSGSAKIHDVLEYPQDSQVLSNFNQMIANARCRPASKNGQAVPSRMVIMFNQVSVYN